MTVNVSKPAFNLREKLSQFDIPIGSHGSQLLRSQSAEETFNLARAGRRRMNVNGDMKICQRGTTKTGASTANFYGPDMAINYMLNSGTWTISQDTDVPPSKEFTHSLSYTCTSAQTSLAANSYLYHIQRIEAVDCWQTQMGTVYAKPVTASFWVKSNITGTLTASLENEGNNMAGGGDGAIHRPVKINRPDTWEYKTVTFPPHTSVGYDFTSAKGLVFDIWFSAGTNYTSGGVQSGWYEIGDTMRAPYCDTNFGYAVNNYVKLTGIQIETGETATPYEHRPYGEELALCMRRCQILGSQYQIAPGGYAPAQNDYNCIGRGWTRSSGIFQTMSFLPVPMCKMPTASTYDFDNLNSPNTTFYSQHNGTSGTDVTLSGINSAGSNLHSIWLDWTPASNAGSVTPCHVGSRAGSRNAVILQSEI